MNEEPSLIDRLTTYEVNVNFPPQQVANMAVGIILIIAIGSFIFFAIKKRYA